MTGVIWFWPGVVLALVLGTLLAAPVARALATRRAIAWLPLVSTGVIVAATLTPIHGPTGIDVSQVRACDLDRAAFASWAELTDVSDVSLNVVLFVPLGLAVGLLPWTRRSALIGLLAVGLPAIEGIQYLAPSLARGCQSGDVIDNLSGLVVGLAVGTLVHAVASRR